MGFHIKTKKGVWTVSALISLLALGMIIVLIKLVYPPELQATVMARAPLNTVIICMSICVWALGQVHKNYLLTMELQRLVNRDRLTDVATRDFFFDRMEGNPDAYGVSLMVDIDHFKMVNDTYGHYVGDAVIKHVSSILRAHCREQDIVCRFGGEEFVVFLHEADEDQGLIVAERMRTNVAASPAVAGEVQVSVTVSIGGSLKDRVEDINISIQQADAALYRAKEAGRNRTVVDWLPERLKPGDSMAA